MIARDAQRQREKPQLSAGLPKKEAPHDSLSSAVRQALSSPDAFVIKAKMTEITESPLAASEVKVAALQEVLDARRNINLVAIAGLHCLRMVSPDHSKELARILLSEPPSDDREMVHGSAIAHLVPAEGVEAQDLALVSACIAHPFPEVRSTCQRALRGMELKPRGALLAGLVASPSEKTKELRLFLQALSSKPAAFGPSRGSSPQEVIWTAERKGAASAIARARVARERESAKPPEGVASPPSASKAPKAGSRPQPAKPASTPKAPIRAESPEPVPAQAPSLPQEPALAVLQAHRRAALHGLRLEALQVGANNSAASAQEVMAHIAEIAVAFGAACAADSMGRLVYLLSDPHLPNKLELQSFSSALMAEATRR